MKRDAIVDHGSRRFLPGQNCPASSVCSLSDDEKLCSPAPPKA
jgi:hypothetical protein